MLGQLLASAQLRCGYPDVLVRAHAHSYFTGPEVTELQAQAITQSGLQLVSDIDLSAIFGPFGGRFK